MAVANGPTTWWNGASSPSGSSRSPLTPKSCSGSRGSSGPSASGPCRRTGSVVPRGPTSDFRGRRPGHRRAAQRVHHAARHRFTARPSWCWRRSTAGRACHHRRATGERRRVPGANQPADGDRAALDREREDGRIHRRLRGQPVQRQRGSRSGSPTMSWLRTVPARSWRVPAHDQRDFEFATKFALPIVPVFDHPEIDTARPLARAFAHGGSDDQLGAVRWHARRRGDRADHRPCGASKVSAKGASPTGCATG